MPAPNLNTFAPTASLPAETRRSIPVLTEGSRVAVVGAGVFGGWAALYLLKKGYRVTLIDSWGPGNSRSSSGDETRVIRSTYGANKTYFDLNVRALSLWKEHEPLFRRKVFHNSGVLWLCYNADTPVVDDSIPYAKAHGMEYERISVDQLRTRFPLINTSDLHHAYLDPFGGYLKARESVIALNELFIATGGTYIQQQAGAPENNHVTLGNGEKIEADLYLYACGPWMGTLFPTVLGSVITCTRQEAYYFGVNGNDASEFDAMPAWVDVDGQDFYYGIPSNANRGFKIGVDIRGSLFEPTGGERTLNPETLAKARKFIGHRFPKLKDAPLLEHRVCPYENSPDGNFIFDVHPTSANVIFLGGGSGHGFKHGPALGELVADVIAGEKERPALFCLR